MPSTKKPAPSGAPASGAEIEFVTAIAKLLDKANVSEIEVERAGLKVRVARHSAAPAAVYAPAPVHHHAPPQAPAAKAPVAETPADLSKHPGAVTSPMVGTAYVSPQPGAAPFVQVGDIVKEDQTLLIVEAMKTMNAIPSPKSGKVVQILIQDSQPVEFGEVLMIIE